jgi:uncharacterized protein YcbK (DUF882 family)
MFACLAALSLTLLAAPVEPSPGEGAPVEDDAALDAPPAVLDAAPVLDAASGRRIAPVDPAHARPLRLLRRGKLHEIALFDAEGRLRHDALAELRALMTDPNSGIDHPTHWRLATLLAAVAHHFPDATIEVVSGYRHVSRHTDRSNHTRGRAVDMRVEGVGNRRLFELLRASFADVGVGYYPNGTFVHLDVRDRATIWVDYSGANETPCYSRTAHADLASGVAERTSYAEAIARGCRRA